MDEKKYLSVASRRTVRTYLRNMELDLETSLNGLRSNTKIITRESWYEFVPLNARTKKKTFEINLWENENSYGRRTSRWWETNSIILQERFVNPRVVEHKKTLLFCHYHSHSHSLKEMNKCSSNGSWNWIFFASTATIVSNNHKVLKKRHLL